MASFYNPDEMNAVWARYLRSWADAIDDGSLEVERGAGERLTTQYLDPETGEGELKRAATGIMTFDATFRWVKEAEEFDALLARPGVVPVDPWLGIFLNGGPLILRDRATEDDNAEDAEDDDEGAE